MRRNLRLDWRALALLGALLSIIIDWPGLMYAMPTNLPPLAMAAPATDTLNVIKNDKIFNVSNPFEHDNAMHVQPSVKDEFNNIDKLLLTTNRSFSDLQEETQRTTTTTPHQLVEKEDISVSTMETMEMPTERRHQQVMANEKQEVNENLNSISQSDIDRRAKTTTTEEEPVENATELQRPQEKVKEEEVSSTNTHVMDSWTTSTPTTTPTTTTTNIPSFPSSIITTTTESSAQIQSTLIPSTIIDNDNAAATHLTKENETDVRSTFQFSSSHHLAILSRTERSIRSSSSSSSVTATAKDMGGGPSTSHSSMGVGVRGLGSGGVGLVRRSSDMGGMKTKRLNNSRNLHNKNNLDRNERSTVSHLSGPSRKIQLYIKNRFLQLMPDGTVNGTPDDQSEYTILQRSTVDVGRIKVQGVATCLYLCMDPCGAVYGSKEFTDDCVFNENMEQHNYNTYSSTYNSNSRRKYYLALNRHGEPRKLQIPPTRSLGKLATYTNAITESVPQERVEQLIAKNFGANRIKHGIRQLCDTGKPLIELIDSKNFKAHPKCNPNSSSSGSNSNSNSNSHNAASNSKNKNNLNSSSSTSLGNSNSGQLLNNVPAANDKTKLSNSSSSNVRNSNSNNKPETNQHSSSNNSQSSISNSQNNGHISNSSSNSKTSTTNNSSSGSPPAKGRGKKLRKCRPYENEEEHNCQRRPQALQKPGRQKRCRELMLQQQQQGITDIVLPPMCKKKGPKKQGAKNKRPPGEGRNKNGLGTDGLGPNNRRGKKLSGGLGGGTATGGRQSAKPNGGNGGGGGQKKVKQKNPKRGGGAGGGGGGGPGVNGKNKKQQKTTTSTTERTSTSPSTSTLESSYWETSSLTPSSTLFDTYDPHAESTSDRGDREQRNVRYSNSMEDSMEVSSEDTSAAVDDNEDDDDGYTGDGDEDASYEDDSFVSSSSHMPHAEADVANPPLTGGADDFLYYDQLDVLPMGLWELTAVIWILVWSLQVIS
ncbi:fibroblast growth factor branchless [Musca autumnalis]|uniref:fibroblast growth factor branchless n=1 Tax=Musca autumnalis TaxID=221902 RepID=UPI003CEEA448